MPSKCRGFFWSKLLWEQGQNKSPNLKGCPYWLFRPDCFVKHLQIFVSFFFLSWRRKLAPNTECYIEAKNLDIFHFLWWLTVTCVCHVIILCLPLNEVALLRVSVDIFKSNTAGQCPQSVKPVEVKLLQWNCTRNSQCDKWDQNLTLLMAGDGRIR